MSWIGGKTKVSEKIIEMIPEHECYCEIFAGGLSIFFKKKPSRIEVVNDTNKELVNFYQVVQKEPEKFKEREKYELYSRSLYNEYLEDFMSGKHQTMNNIERAFRFFFIISASFSAEFGVGWAYSATGNKAQTFFNKFKLIDDISKRLKNVQIDNRDFSDVIKGYDNKDTFILADPPYFKADVKKYYFQSNVGNDFTAYDHQRLFNDLKSMKGKFLLTIDDVPWYRERYTKENGFWTIENRFFYSAANVNKEFVTELIICNYNPEKIKHHVDVRQGQLDF